MWPIPIVDWELHIMNRKNTKMRLLHLKKQFQPERRRHAISYYEKALDHSDCSDDMKQEIQFNVIVCYEKLEDWDNAKAKLEDYVTAYPDDEKAAKEAEFLKTR